MIDQLIEGELMERAFPNLDTNSFEKWYLKKNIVTLNYLYESHPKLLLGIL